MCIYTYIICILTDWTAACMYIQEYGGIVRYLVLRMHCGDGDGTGHHGIASTGHED